jgi:hypothetical protein
MVRFPPKALVESDALQRQSSREGYALCLIAVFHSEESVTATLVGDKGKGARKVPGIDGYTTPRRSSEDS